MFLRGIPVSGREHDTVDAVSWQVPVLKLGMSRVHEWIDHTALSVREEWTGLDVQWKASERPVFELMHHTPLSCIVVRRSVGWRDS